MTTLIVPDPLALCRTWQAELKATPTPEPTAAILATATRTGVPSARTVLIKAIEDRGFVFYTNLGSAKAHELDENPQAALCMYMGALGRQLRVSGPVERVTAAEADAYFSSRPRMSQVGAWASRQSEPLTSPQQLVERVQEVTDRFAEQDVPRPEFWSGFRVVPLELEFWVAKEFRQIRH